MTDELEGPPQELAEPPTRLCAKLDALGIPLDPAVWTRLPLAARRRLARMPTEGRVAERTLVAWADWLRATFHPDADDQPGPDDLPLDGEEG